MEWWAMFDINMEIEILERCASECALISNLATDRRARVENGALAAEYRLMAANLKHLPNYTCLMTIDRSSQPMRRPMVHDDTLHLEVAEVGGQVA